MRFRTPAPGIVLDPAIVADTQSLYWIVILVGLYVLIGYLNFEEVVSVVQSLAHLITVVGCDKIGHVCRFVVARGRRVGGRIAVAAPITASGVRRFHRRHHTISQGSFGLLKSFDGLFDYIVAR